MRRKTFTRAITSGLCALVLLGMSSVPRATADCYSVGPQKGAIQPESWQGSTLLSPPSFLQVVLAGCLSRRKRRQDRGLLENKVCI
jgi:hypothetical protein